MDNETLEVLLPAGATALLAELAARAGVTPEAFARAAILERMEDTEDYLVAEERLRTSDGTAISLSEAMSKHADKRSAAE